MKTMNLSGARTSRAFVGAIMIGGMLIGTRPSHADWALLRTEANGTYSVAGVSKPWAFMPARPDIYNALAQTTNTVNPITVSSSGTLTLIFGWTPSFPGQVRPKTLNVLVTPSASVSSEGDGTPVSFSGLTVDDGHKSPQQLIVTGDATHSNRSYTSQSKQLVSVDVSGGSLTLSGVWEVKVPVSGLQATTTAQAATTPIHASLVQAYVGASGVVDTRSVTLTRAGATAQQFSGNTTKGDTTFAYTTDEGLYFDHTDNPQTISAIANSSWGAASTWSWVTAATADTKTSHVIVTAPSGKMTWDGSQ